MNTSVKIVDDQLICIKYNHKEQVMLVQVDDQVPFKDKFLCSKCLETHQNVAKIMSLKSVIDDIKEKIAKKNIKLDEEKQDSLKSIKQFCLKMNDLQTKVTKMFNEIQSITQQWIRDLEKLQSQNDVINIIKELEGNDSHQDNDVQKNNQAYFNKLSSTFKKLLEFKNYEDCYDDIKQMFIQKSPIGRQEQQPKVSQVQLIQRVKQEEYSCAMAFNYQRAIMLSGCNKEQQFIFINMKQFHEQILIEISIILQI